MSGSGERWETRSLGGLDLEAIGVLTLFDEVGPVAGERVFVHLALEDEIRLDHVVPLGASGLHLGLELGELFGLEARGGLVRPVRLGEPGHGGGAGATHASDEQLAAGAGGDGGTRTAAGSALVRPVHGRPVAEGVGEVVIGDEDELAVLIVRILLLGDDGIGDVHPGRALVLGPDGVGQVLVVPVDLALLAGDEDVLGGEGELVPIDHLVAHLIGEADLTAGAHEAAAEVGAPEELGGRLGRPTVLTVLGRPGEEAAGRGVAGRQGADGPGVLLGLGQLCVVQIGQHGVAADEDRDGQLRDQTAIRVDDPDQGPRRDRGRPVVHFEHGTSLPNGQDRGWWIALTEPSARAFWNSQTFRKTGQNPVSER